MSYQSDRFYADHLPSYRDTMQVKGDEFIPGDLADKASKDLARLRAGVGSSAVPLTDANVTITLAQSAWRVLPAATLTAARVVTLDVTGASVGDQIEITRLDVTANTFTIRDGGPGTPNLFVMPASKAGSVMCQFDGTAWKLRSFGSQ